MLAGRGALVSAADDGLGEQRAVAEAEAAEVDLAVGRDVAGGGADQVAPRGRLGAVGLRRGRSEAGQEGDGGQEAAEHAPQDDGGRRNLR